MSCTPNKKYIRRRRGACDSCKQRKVRCDGENPCTACHRSGSSCHYQPSVTRPKRGIFISIDTDITNCHTPPPLYLDTNSPAFDSIYDYSTFTPDGSCRSAVSWNSEFSPSSAISPEVECFQAFSPSAEYAGQTAWAYPGDPVKEPYIQQLFDQCPLPDAAGYEGYISNDSTEQDPFLCFVSSPESLSQDHVLCSNEYAQDSSLTQPLFTGKLFIVTICERNIDKAIVPTFSARALFSDLRFMNHQKIIGYPGLPEFLDDAQAQYWTLKLQPQAINPLDVQYNNVVKLYIDGIRTADFIRSVSLFLQKEHIYLLAQQVLEKKVVDNSSVCLIYTALAIGCYAIKVERDGDVNQGLAEACGYFQVAEYCQQSIVDTEFSTECFLVLFAQKLSRDHESNILSQVSKIALRLKLHSILSIELLSVSEQSKLSLQRAYWLYYSLEKLNSLRLGQNSIIDDNIIDHQPPSSRLKSELSSCASPTESYYEYEQYDFLLLQCRFAKICSLIINMLYSPCGLQKPSSELFSKIFQLDALLKYWKDTIPASIRPLDPSSRANFVPGSFQVSQEQLNLSYQYYEALWAIHGRWRLCLPLLMSDEDRAHMETSHEMCFNVAIMVLNISSEFRISTLLSHWSTLQLPMCASLIISLDAIDFDTNDANEKLFPYVRIAENFYTGLSLLENTSYKSVLGMIKFLRETLFR